MKGERADVVKREDNLRMEGDFTQRKVEQVVKGERRQLIKHEDNLHMEGSFSMKTINRNIQTELAKKIFFCYHR